MTSIAAQARHDAKEYARAKMYYGEGAGNRRKLIEATVESKGAKNPKYAQEFHKALSKEDYAEHAAKARRERQRKDVGRALSMNSKGLATGNYATVNTTVLLVAAGIYLAHKNGLDVKYYGIAKQKVHAFREKHSKKAGHNPPDDGQQATIHHVYRVQN